MDRRALARYVDLLRPHQYVKNLFVFLPLFFGARIGDASVLARNVAAFLAFCLCASAVYIVNDILDRDEDRSHPRKRTRPIASGEVPVRSGWVIAAVLLALSAIPIAALGRPAGSPGVAFLFSAYVALNALYSLKLKHYAIVDVVVIATGFVLRIMVGAAVSAVPLSMWMIFITFLLATFLALSKRRDDVLTSAGNPGMARRSVDGYTLEFINAAMVIMASVVVVSYIMYTVSPEVIAKFRSDRIYLTTIFVLLGILRYLQITFVEQDSGSPTRILLRDRFIQATVVGWILSFVAILYWK